MEKSVNYTINDMVSSQGKASHEIVITVMLNILNSLKAYHADGKVYGAVLPGNLNVYPGDNYKVELRKGVDPVLLPDDLSAASLDELLGLSPEHFNQNMGLDHRSDLYGLGYSTYYLLTGEANPYGAKTSVDLAEKITQAVLPDLSLVNPDVPEWLAKIVQKLTAPDRSQRYQSVFSLIRNLESGLASEPRPAEAPPFHEPPVTVTKVPQTPSGTPISDFNPYKPAIVKKPRKSSPSFLNKGLFAGLAIVIVVVAALLFFLKRNSSRQENNESILVDTTLVALENQSLRNPSEADIQTPQADSQISNSQIMQNGMQKKITMQVNKLRIRKTPGTDGEILATVNEGDEAITTGRITAWQETIALRGNDYTKPWIEITIGNNVTGWVFAGATDY